MSALYFEFIAHCFLNYVQAASWAMESLPSHKELQRIRRQQHSSDVLQKELRHTRKSLELQCSDCQGMIWKSFNLIFFFLVAHVYFPDTNLTFLCVCVCGKLLRGKKTTDFRASCQNKVHGTSTPSGCGCPFGRLYGLCCASTNTTYMANVLLQSAACLVLSDINIIYLSVWETNSNLKLEKSYFASLASVFSKL